MQAYIGSGGYMRAVKEVGGGLQWKRWVQACSGGSIGAEGAEFVEVSLGSEFRGYCRGPERTVDCKPKR